MRIKCSTHVISKRSLDAFPQSCLQGSVLQASVLQACVGPRATGWHVEMVYWGTSCQTVSGGKAVAKAYLLPGPLRCCTEIGFLTLMAFSLQTTDGSGTILALDPVSDKEAWTPREIHRRDGQCLRDESNLSHQVSSVVCVGSLGHWLAGWSRRQGTSFWWRWSSSTNAHVGCAQGLIAGWALAAWVCSNPPWSDGGQGFRSASVRRAEFRRPGRLLSWFLRNSTNITAGSLSRPCARFAHSLYKYFHTIQLGKNIDKMTYDVLNVIYHLRCKKCLMMYEKGFIVCNIFKIGFLMYDTWSFM